MDIQIDNKGKGVVRTISGKYVDLAHPDDTSTLDITDIAWSLGRQLRYNGHMQPDYTVAHHCVIMSYCVPREYALEALLHDAAEGYTGDIVHPVKELLGSAFKSIDAKLSGRIFSKFADKATKRRCITSAGRYKMSAVIKAADHMVYAHECYSFRDGRPGTYSKIIQDGWVRAATAHEDLWGASYYPYLHRYYELIGAKISKDRINELVLPLWYRPADEIDDEVTASFIDRAMTELGGM